MKTMKRVMGVKSDKQTLNFLQCIEALQRYILAGAMCKQFKYSSGLAHIAIVTQVASKAAKEGKRHAAAVLYDERVREKWAEEAYKAGKDGQFDLDAAMCTLDVKVCEEVCREPTRQSVLNTTLDGKVKGGGKGTVFMGTCNYCGKQGHRKADCLKLKNEQKRALQASASEDGQPQRKLRKPWPERR